ncbi:MAG: MgtC/SapB family protein [Acidobacteriia bacterium]|nr:MgtC/SapB family protein [Terriglobia bacterium]
MPTYTQIAWHGAMALLLGLLIGLERQHSQRGDEPLFAGVRTFPIIVLSGYLAGLLTQAGFIWVLPVALAGTCAIVVTAYASKVGGPHKGATTEFVAVLAFILGALTALGFLIPAATFAVVTTLLLSTKAPLHQLAERIREEELYAILKFGIVSVIVLPLLPNRPYGPFQVLNPRLIWWMVVLISGVSMIGYVLMRLLGARRGVAVTGVLGGIASSTAVTFGLSQKAHDAEDLLAKYFALGIVIASTIMFLRMLLLTFVIDPHLAPILILPMALPVVIGVGVGILLWRQKGAQQETALEVKNPMELGSAIKFGLIFAGVLFISRAAYYYFGSSGIYAAGALAGLADVDAFTISAAGLARQGVLARSTAGGSILLAGAMNTLVKGGIAAFLGGRALRRVILPIFVAMVLAAIVACIAAAHS